MGTKKLKIQMNGRSDEYFTPSYALNPLLPYLKKRWRIWECAWGKGFLAKHLENKGFSVKGDKNHNFLEHGFPDFDFDCIITNPPYSKKEDFLRCAYAYGKPFAFLMPLTTLEGIKRGDLFKRYGIQLIIPNKRINFIMPNKQGSSWFATAWFCHGLNLPKQA